MTGETLELKPTGGFGAPSRSRNGVDQAVRADPLGQLGDTSIDHDFTFDALALAYARARSPW
ncbi:MAG: hypothetical protein U0527_17875 [Candidatus Eisenbacteria bacterium]